jgi:hypothetical protein
LKSSPNSAKKALAFPESHWKYVWYWVRLF